MSHTIDELKCDHCNSSNWMVSEEWDGVDITSGEDIEAFNCWHCGQASYVPGIDEVWIEVCGYESPEDAHGIVNGYATLGEANKELKHDT